MLEQTGFLLGLKLGIRLVCRYGGGIFILPLANRNKNFYLYQKIRKTGHFLRNNRLIWYARRDSNPRPFGSEEFMERNSAVNRAILGRNIRSYQRNYHITDTLVLRDPRNVDPILEPLKKQRCTSAYDLTAYPEYRVLACLAQPAAEYSACWRGIRFQCQGNLQFPCECAMCSFHFNGLRLGLLCLYTFCKFDQIFNLHFENPPPLFILYAKSSKYKSKF